jgi:hypothetical protein
MAMLDQFDTPVRCSRGHLYTTIWMPYASVKGVRLGWKRWQRCPVGKHWSVTTRLDPATTSAEDLAEAARVHDWPVP